MHRRGSPDFRVTGRSAIGASQRPRTPVGLTLDLSSVGPAFRPDSSAPASFHRITVRRSLQAFDFSVATEKQVAGVRPTLQWLPNARHGFCPRQNGLAPPLAIRIPRHRVIGVEDSRLTSPARKKLRRAANSTGDDVSPRPWRMSIGAVNSLARAIQANRRKLIGFWRPVARDRVREQSHGNANSAIHLGSPARAQFAFIVETQSRMGDSSTSPVTTSRSSGSSASCSAMAPPIDQPKRMT